MANKYATNSYGNSTQVKPKAYIPVAAIVFAFFFFWPIGVYLLVKRKPNNIETLFKTGRTCCRIGIFFLVSAPIWYLILIGELNETAGQDGVSALIMAIVIYAAALGLVPLYYGRKMKASAYRYDKIKTLVRERIFYIDLIASSVQSTYNQTVEDLIQMIGMGYFNAYIDLGSKTLVPFSAPNVGWSQHVQPQHVQHPAPPKEKAVVCPSCGAKNTILEGKMADCEYCGTRIQ